MSVPYKDIRHGTIYAEPNGIFVRVDWWSRVCVCERGLTADDDECWWQVQGRFKWNVYLSSPRMRRCESHYFVLNSTQKTKCNWLNYKIPLSLSVAWMSLEQKRFELLLIHIRRTARKLRLPLRHIKTICSAFFISIHSRHLSTFHFLFFFQILLSHFIICRSQPPQFYIRMLALLNEWNGRREAIMHAINCVRRNRRSQYCTTATVLRHKTSNNIEIAMPPFLHIFLSIYHARGVRKS